jgi:hypothetical protein
MWRACEYAAELGLVIQTHSEDPSLRQDGVMNEGVVSQRLGLPGNPAAAEAIAIYRDCEVAALTGARVHIAHVSSERGMRVIEYFKAQGAPVSCEVTPQHLTLTDEALADFDPIRKVAPPLRTAADVAYLRGAVQRGTVDSIGTDHAPHTRAEKERSMLEAPFGIGNIEVAFPLLYSELVLEGVLDLPDLLALFTTGPAAVMGWEAPTLEVGKPADLVALDLETEAPVRAETFLSKAKFSPWEGQGLRGWPVRTVVGEKVVFIRESEEVAGCAQAGSGRRNGGPSLSARHLRPSWIADQQPASEGEKGRSRVLWRISIVLHPPHRPHIARRVMLPRIPLPERRPHLVRPGRPIDQPEPVQLRILERQRKPPAVRQGAHVPVYVEHLVAEKDEPRIVERRCAPLRRPLHRRQQLQLGAQRHARYQIVEVAVEVQPEVAVHDVLQILDRERLAIGWRRRLAQHRVEPHHLVELAQPRPLEVALPGEGRPLVRPHPLPPLGAETAHDRVPDLRHAAA